MTLLSDIKIQIDKHEIISFDIFDTLLLRPYVKPTDLFFHLERLENSEGFATARIKAEKQARKKHPNKEDITIDEIYDEIDERFKNLKEKEMAMERQILIANPEMKEVYEYAKAQGKRIIIVSDMYLSEEFLADVLREKGYEGFEKLFVSSKYGKLKYSSNLYRIMLEQMHTHPQYILHIGDNEYKDVQAAQKLNISAILYPCVLNRFLEKEEMYSALLDSYPQVLGFSIIIMMAAIYNLTNSGNYWDKFGYNIAGPICLNFINWIKDDIIKRNINDIIFIARDGYILQKIFNLYDYSTIKTHYIYAPRSLNLICRLNYEKEGSFAYEHAKTIINFYKEKNSVLNNLPEAKTKEDALNILEEHRDVFAKLADKEKEEYARYVSKEELSNSVATVDSVSMFFSAQKFFEELFPDNHFRGYYYQIQSGADVKNNDVVSYKDIAPYSTDLRLIEFIMTSPEAPIKYVMNGKPIYKEISDQEYSRMVACEEFSKSAVRFAQDMKSYFGNMSLYLSSSDIFAFIKFFINYPKNEDIDAFSKILFAYDPEHKKYQKIFDNWTPRVLTSNEILQFIRLNISKIPLLTFLFNKEKKMIKIFNIPFFTYINERQNNEHKN